MAGAVPRGVALLAIRGGFSMARVRSFRLQTVWVVLGVACLTGALAAAVPQAPGPQNGDRGGAPGSAPAAPAGPLAPDKYQNIQVLKDMPADQLEPTMRFVAAATGMRCAECHVQEADGTFSYDKDDQRAKGTAREMMKIERAVNDQFFNGRTQVTCYTCHRGNGRPVSQPSLAEMLTPEQIAEMNQPARVGGPGRAGPGGFPGRGRGAPLPAVDDVVTKYIAAIGGGPAVEKLQSLVLAGTLTNRANQNLGFTIEAKTPNRFRETVQEQPSPVTRVFDGTNAWMQTGQTVTDLSGVALDQAVEMANLAMPFSAASLGSLRAVRGFPIDGNATAGLAGPVSTYVTQALYFDASSGLLLRRTFSTRTALGNLMEQVDYSDYRDVAGVKLPFTIRRSGWDYLETLKVVDVKPNAQVNDGRFARP
jgi:photosynthetic reaction center cytochrome c subunit